MIITHVGHAEFLLELENGTKIVTDPYDKSCGYPDRHIQADSVLVSHGHHDHNAVETVAGVSVVVDREGIHTLAPDVRVTALTSYHDDTQGSQRGKTLLFLIEAEGLRIVHMGDLGCMPDEETLRKLAHPDVLMIPVGGFFTIDGPTAVKVAEKLQPGTLIPMHYRTAYNEGWPIEPVDGFLKASGEAAEYGTLLRVTAGDLECQPKIMVLDLE